MNDPAEPLATGAFDWQTLEELEDVSWYTPIRVLRMVRRMFEVDDAVPLEDPVLVSPGPLAADTFVMAVGAGLRRLPPHQQAVLMLVDMMGYPSDEAAEALGVSVPELGELLADGRAHLARLLSPRGVRPAEAEAVGGVLRLREGLQRMRDDPGERARVAAIAADAVEDELPPAD